MNSEVEKVDDRNPNAAIDRTRTVKRQKIAIACNICKNRKSRCDGLRPGTSLELLFTLYPSEDFEMRMGALKLAGSKLGMRCVLLTS
jgi:hypothetical protein